MRLTVCDESHRVSAWMINKRKWNSSHRRGCRPPFCDGGPNARRHDDSHTERLRRIHRQQHGALRPLLPHPKVAAKAAGPRLPRRRRRRGGARTRRRVGRRARVAPPRRLSVGAEQRSQATVQLRLVAGSAGGEHRAQVRPHQRQHALAHGRRVPATHDQICSSRGDQMLRRAQRDTAHQCEYTLPWAAMSFA